MTAPTAANKTAIGVSWGSDYGVVSNSVITSKNLQSANIAEIIKQPAVLANADGNRAPSVWLNVASDEFLLSDGARNANLRFPQNAINGIVNLLDEASSKKTVSVCKKVRPYQNENEEPGSPTSADTNDEFKAVTVHTDAKDSGLKDLQGGKFSVFLEQAKRNLKFDADGLIPKTRFKVESEDGDGKAIVEDTIRLPETTWECALAVARIFRTIIKDSLSAGSAAATPVSPTGKGAAAAAGGSFPPAGGASTGLETPTTIVVSIPRHRTNVHASYSLLRLAWHDWCMKSPNNQYPSQLKIVHDDVAALAAVLPKERLLNCANDKAVEADLTTPHVALVVNWGASQLTVSLMLQTCEPVMVMKSPATGEESEDNAKKSHPMMICLASKTIDREVGGAFIDQKLTENELLMTARRKKLPPVETGSRGFRKFLIAAEKAKVVLSSSQTTSVEIEAAVEGMDFVDPSLTRSKLEMIINMTCRLPMKFTELMNSLFAEFLTATTTDASKKKLLPLFTRSNKIKFGVVLSGGTLAIPSLQNTVKTQGTQGLEKFLKSVVEQQKAVVEIVPANYVSAGIELQEICSIGACYLAQTGCVMEIVSSGSVPSFALSSEKNRSTVFAKPQLALLSCDIGLMKKGAESSVVTVFPGGCNVPAKRQIGEVVSTKDFAGFVIVNKVSKKAIKIPFEDADREMILQCTITVDGIFRVIDAKKGGEKLCEVQLI